MVKTDKFHMAVTASVVRCIARSGLLACAMLVLLALAPAAEAVDDPDVSLLIGGPALVKPEGVALDSAGNLFVADYGNSRISVFSPAGAFLRAFGKGVNQAGGDVCTEASGCERGAVSFSGVAGESTSVSVFPPDITVALPDAPFADCGLPSSSLK